MNTCITARIVNIYEKVITTHIIVCTHNFKYSNNCMYTQT